MPSFASGNTFAPARSRDLRRMRLHCDGNVSMLPRLDETRKTLCTICLEGIVLGFMWPDQGAQRMMQPIVFLIYLVLWNQEIVVLAALNRFLRRMVRVKGILITGAGMENGRRSRLGSKHGKSGGMAKQLGPSELAESYCGTS